MCLVFYFIRVRFDNYILLLYNINSYSKNIFNFVQKNINMYVVKDIIRENSMLISYKMNGKSYTPKRILL